jgi:predicted TIM-barrel fold metal-dependent hydrolase
MEILRTGAAVFAASLLAAGCMSAEQSSAPVTRGAQATPPPVIDMHLHAGTLDPVPPPPTAVCTPLDPPAPIWDQRRSFAEVYAAMLKMPPCDDPIWSPTTDAALRDETVAALERANVIGVLGGTGLERSPVIDDWIAAAPERFIPGSRCVPTLPDCSVDYLRELHVAGKLDVLAELYLWSLGMAPDDVRLDPYWALAEELDIPVGIHISAAIPPGIIHIFARDNRARLHSPLALEDVLVRHPRLRLYVMHAGYPMLDETLALLYAHPQVYVDVAAIVWHMPRDGFYRYLEALVDAGFGKRVMFGSDNLQWPGLIERSIAVIDEAPFLSEQERRDILYHNAARFLRLSEEEIARHHAM